MFPRPTGQQGLPAIVLGALVFGALGASPASGQLANSKTGFNKVGNGFFENVGVGFGFNLPGGASFSGPSGLGGGATFGFGMGGGGGLMSFGLSAGQGNTSSLGSQSGSVTVPNGGFGGVTDVTQRPFVTSFGPVGNVDGSRIYPVLPPIAVSPLVERIGRLGETAASGGSRAAPPREIGDRIPEVEIPPPVVGASLGSSAGRGDASVSEIRRRQAAEDAADAQNEIEALIERARGAEAQGKAGVAKVYYRMAANRAGGELKERLLQKVASLGSAE
jgi:hypothetical protein